jgi:hypothetical protein
MNTTAAVDAGILILDEQLLGLVSTGFNIV